ncbi:MAG: TIGR04283 family arsenosugar biosynthesis glycosyltransferase [Deltaproteobacteria bacterium]|nr:TIGR04283 family arsenosugar biosynthesis glycosyltransferase [Deltaproteobacteria bacterium]
MQISVIIPTLNEENQIAKTLGSVGRGVEVIVVDGGSVDNTASIAEKFGARVIKSEKGRGVQQDIGAANAKGDVLLFLHADTILPSGWRDFIAVALSGSNVIGGAFLLGIDSSKPLLKFIIKAANIRAKYLGLIYGDQAIFARREGFFRAGGFKGLPIMEDVDFIRRLKKQGKVKLIMEKVLTSERRWDKKGVLQNTLDNWFLLLMYYLGYSPERIYRLYYKR